jgi:hypothetical protein
MCELVKRYCKKRNKIPCAAVVGNKTDKEREVNQTDLKVYVYLNNWLLIVISCEQYIGYNHDDTKFSDNIGRKVVL